MFDGPWQVPPLPPGVPIGPDGRLVLLLLLGCVLVALAYFFFELCDALMSEEFWHDVEELQARRKGKKWWQI
jgi:hypothetical protein